MAENTKEVNTMKSKYEASQQEIQTLMKKSNDLEQYTRNENLPLLFVPEEDDENCEEVVVRCLTEMGINPASMNFHAVHRVGKKKPSPTNSTEEEVSLRQIIVRLERTWIMYGRLEKKLRQVVRECIFCTRSHERERRDLIQIT